MIGVQEAETKESYLALGSDVCAERPGGVEMNAKYFNE